MCKDVLNYECVLSQSPQEQEIATHHPLLHPSIQYIEFIRFGNLAESVAYRGPYRGPNRGPYRGPYRDPNRGPYRGPL